MTQSKATASVNRQLFTFISSSSSHVADFSNHCLCAVLSLASQQHRKHHHSPSLLAITTIFKHFV